MKQIDGQINIFEYLKELEPSCCSYSGHKCNKKELWKVADTLDIILCPHVCCRKCAVRSCGARCNGSEEPQRASVQEQSKKVTMFGQEWNPIEQKPEGINPEDDLEVLGTYKYNDKVNWSCCHAYYDGNEIIAIDVPWDIPRPVWKYWRLKERVYPVEIFGICDDAFCSKCGDGIDELNWMDCERCPSCGARISWEPWHRMNDEDNQLLFGEKWRDRFGKKTKEQGQKK